MLLLKRGCIFSIGMPIPLIRQQYHIIWMKVGNDDLKVLLCQANMEPH